MKAVTIIVCAAVAIGLGAINIWLGIAALPIVYGICESLVFGD